MAKGSSSRFSSAGTKTKSVELSAALTILYSLTLLFALIYIVCIATEDLEPGQNNADGEVNQRTNDFTYMIVIGASTLTLLFLQYYDASSSLINIARLSAILVLLVFVCLSIPIIIDSANEALTAQDGADYTIGAFAIAFGGAAALINLMEVLRRSDIDLNLQF